MAEEGSVGGNGGGGGRGGLRTHVRVPHASRGTQRATRKKTSLAPYDDEMVKLNNDRQPPAKIAEILCVEHGLDPEVVNRKAVESRLRYLKKNSLKTLAPVNINTSLEATDDPIAVCLCFFFSFIFLTVSAGQKAADSIGRVLTESEDPPPPFPSSEKRDDDVSADDIIIAFLRDAGFLYFWEGEQAWHIIIARTMTATVNIGEAAERGCRLFFKAVGPTNSELSACSIISTHIQELHLLRTKSSIFLTSPRPLSQDRSLVKSESFPKEHPRWLVYVIPWKDSEKNELVELPPFLFE